MHDQAPLTTGPVGGRTVVLLHGRGADSQSMLSFAQEYLPPSRFIALQADSNVWYPRPFIVEREHNEPFLSAALAAVHQAVEKAGVPASKVVLLGFSQGACLAAEYAARYPRKYGGIIAFSGGLIGQQIIPPEGSLEGTPVVFGCSEHDPFIPLDRVQQSASAFRAAQAAVHTHTYQGSSHTITAQELALAIAVLEEI